MALGTNHLGITHATGGDPGGFVPTKWIDDVIVTYNQNLVLANKCKRIDFSGNKGDAINLPSLTDRGSPSAKAENTVVSLITRTDSEVIISLDKHYEYSFLIEDRVSMQALDSILREYMEDAGYGLAKQVDQDLFATFSDIGGSTGWDAAVIGDGSTTWDPTANTNIGNASALTDAGIRNVIQTLDDSDNPMMGRSLVIPPVERNNLMGLARFTEQAFIGSGDAIRNGIIGNIYGVDVAISTNCPHVHDDTADGTAVYNFSSAAIGTGSVANPATKAGTAVTVTTDGGVVGRVALMFHKDAVALAEQQDLRLQSQYKLEYLGDLHVADRLYGVQECRDYAGVGIVVAN